MSPPADFAALVAAHERGVLRLCRAVLQDEHLGADAAQETFLRLWRELERGAAPTQLAAWLRRVALSAALDLQRRRRAREEAHARSADAAPAAAVSEPDPTAPLVAAELRQRFEAALARLPDGQRTVFLLRHEGGLGLSEVAETLGLAPTTVKTHFARACLRLQAALSAHRHEGETSEP